MNKHTKGDLNQMQSLPLRVKVRMTERRVRAWYDFYHNEVYVSFSGGKDSTVIADICAKCCRLTGVTLYLVFVNTGLEYPEIQKFVKEYAEYLRNKYDIEVVLEILRPKMRFDEVIKKYGYPVISKSVSNCVRGALNGSKSRMNLLNGKNCDGSEQRSKFSKLKYKPLLDVDFKISEFCCDVMKKKPSHEYAKRTNRKPILATMAVESMLREKDWLSNGCNAFNAKYPASKPMSFWTEQDVFQYIKEEQLPIASVYGDIVYAEEPEQMRLEDYGIDCGGREKLRTTGCDRTGCIFCAFGCHLEKEPSRFQRLKETHPRQYEYCIGGGEYNEDGVWQPNKEGLGMRHVFDELNRLYGDGFIKY